MANEQTRPAAQRLRSAWRSFLRAVIFAIALPVILLIMPVRVKGRKNLPKGQPFLVAANHLSALDPIYVVRFLLPRRVTIMAKEELFTHTPAIVGWFLGIVGAVPVKRASGDVGAMRTALQALKQGDMFLIFPEGTRDPNGDGTLGEFNAGVGMMAMMARVPVVPVRFFPHGRGRIFRRVDIAIGTPLQPAHLPQGAANAARARAATAQVRESIEKLTF